MSQSENVGVRELPIWELREACLALGTIHRRKNHN